MSQRKTRGRKDYFLTHITPSGRVKVLYPPCGYTYWCEGDVTFNGRGDSESPRKVKKWIRKQMGWDRYRPWWTSHKTRSAAVPKGALH